MHFDSITDDKGRREVFFIYVNALDKIPNSVKLRTWTFDCPVVAVVEGNSGEREVYAQIDDPQDFEKLEEVHGDDNRLKSLELPSATTS